MDFERKIERQKIPELMPMPEIKTEINEGYFWYTILQKAINPDWEQLSDEHEFSNQLDEYFTKNKIDEELRQKWQDVISKIDNDEILFWFSLAVDNPELESSVFEDCEKHKNLEKAKSQQLFQTFKSIINKFREKYQNIWSLLEPYLNEDLEKREKSTEEEVIIRQSLDYFRPKKETSDIQEVNYLPTNFLIKKTIGSGFSTKNKGIVISHFNNLYNKRHEFLHFIINPITDKVEISKEQEQAIVDMASRDLIVGQGYGEHSYSLLNEVLIRGYCDLVEGKKPLDLKTFKGWADGLSREEFERVKKEKEEIFKEMEIANSVDLKEKLGELYERHVRNVLGEKVYNLYQNFDQEKQNNPNLTFEDYFLESYQRVLGL